MPNICLFDLRIKGNKRDIKTFFDYLQADYNYNEDGTYEIYLDKNNRKIHLPYHIGYRIFSFNYTEKELDSIPDDKEILFEGYGSCAWSVTTCMLKADSTGYINSYPRPTALSLEDACKLLSCEVEVFSEEDGMAFAEHIHVSSTGKIETDDCVDFNNIYIAEYETYEDCIADYGEVLTKDQFVAGKHSGEDSIVFCDLLNEDGTWEWNLE